MKKNKTLNIVFLGPDGAGKSTIINELKIELKQTADTIEIIHLKPAFWKKESLSPQVVTEPHKKQPRTAFFSIGKIISWLFLYWIDRLLHTQIGLTIRFWDRYYHDLIVDPRRYRYGAPECTALLIGELIPKPDLWILLDAPPEILQARKKEVSFQETCRQRKAYVNFLASKKNSSIIDASQSIKKIIKEIKPSIIKLIEKHT